MWRGHLTGCIGGRCYGDVGSGDDNNSSRVHDQESPNMDQPDESRINDDHFIQTSITDMSPWKKRPKKACPERSDVIDGIVRKQRADYLGVVVEHGWDVNEMLEVCVPGRGRVKRTALHHAVFYRWHDGVRLLLGAGADCNIKCKWSGVADLSVPHHIDRDQNQHFGSIPQKHVPLCVAIYKDDVEMVKLLLQNGADLKNNGCDYIAANVERLEMLIWIPDGTEMIQKENSKVLNELLTSGKKIRRKTLDEKLQCLLNEYYTGLHFFPDHLDAIFTHGVHIDPEYEGATLTHAFYRECPINAIRWLIRHGACCPASLHPMLCLASITYRMMQDNDFLVERIQRYKLPLLEVLLQVGMKPSDSLKVHLSKLELMIQAYLQQAGYGDQDDEVIVRKTANIYLNIIRGEESYVRCERRKPLPIDREQQMTHLKEFSNHSLDVYPEQLKLADNKRERWEHTLKIVASMLHFLNQPKPLQWHCRICLRKSLVSLSPSVITTLSAPGALKHYILCHEL